VAAIKSHTRTVLKAHTSGIISKSTRDKSIVTTDSWQETLYPLSVVITTDDLHRLKVILTIAALVFTILQRVCH